MNLSRPQKLIWLVIILQLFGAVSAAAGELIVDVYPEQVRKVIERNEMQYEEYRWHSYADRIRIAKINIDLLRQSDKTITITPFIDRPPIVVTSAGIEDSRWTGEKTQGAIPEETLKAALEKQGHPEVFDVIMQQYNRVELYVKNVFKDQHTGKYTRIPADYEIVPAGSEIGDVFSNVPIFREEDVEIVTQVYGTINVLDDPSSQGKHRSYTIKLLENDAEYVMVYEWDNSKNHHLMEPPNDPEAWAQSELGQKYERLRKEKEEYMADVAERIAQRNKQ
jgi:hypothetical protein